MLETALQQLRLVVAAMELKLVIPAAAALAGVWLQARLSRRQTFRNKLWELRQESYGQFLSSVRDLWKKSESWLAIGDEGGSDADFQTIDAGLEALGRMSTAGSLMWGKHFLDAAYKWKTDWEKAGSSAADRIGELKAFTQSTAAHFDAIHLAARRDLQTS